MLHSQFHTVFEIPLCILHYSPSQLELAACGNSYQIEIMRVCTHKIKATVGQSNLTMMLFVEVYQ